MTRRALVRSICLPSASDSGGAELPKFIRCVDGRELQIHKVWAFGSDDITHEVHPTAQVDVSAGVVGEFSSNYLTRSGRMIPILRKISIIGSVEYLGITDFHRTSGPFWDANLLAPCSIWGDGGTTTNQNWGIQLWGLMEVFPSRGIVPSLSFHITPPV